MYIKAKTISELTPDEAAFLGIPIFGHPVRYGQAIFMSKAEAEQRLANQLRKQQGASMTNAAKVARNLGHLSIDDQKKKFQTAVTANTPPVPVGSGTTVTPSPEVLALGTTLGQIGDLEDLITSTGTTLAGLNKQHADLMKLGGKQYGALGGVVEIAADGVGTYIIAHGYDVVQPATHVTSLPQVMNLHASSGDPERSVHLNWNTSVVTGVNNVIESTIDPLGKTGFTQTDTCTASHYTVLNLAPGTYWFRVAVRKGKVQGAWSDPVRFTVTA